MIALASELQDISLGDKRLNHRAQQVLETLGAKPTQSIPGACNGWYETRAAYRFFDHPTVTAEQILAPHFACTEERPREHPRVLCIQDTSELDYTIPLPISPRPSVVRGWTQLPSSAEMPFHLQQGDGRPWTKRFQAVYVGALSTRPT
ncbi:IS4/Tn5 family transposase DNA-binding protein [Thiorhodovibrio litoralis]|uniref:IS4/Tn5 family transposase DNA-binding protein n=1 Tax=Thiorhodovibrio litoralis TaxID=2952932 RepID=UPI002B257921|nr:transposase DNA-binding-containing protein [Thiorhodovibrio litoralis]WPL14291.1 hypothetical protein Thiosp_04127 [Thiorhodovibrio litoralis]